MINTHEVFMGKRIWTDDQLVEAVKASLNITEVVSKLGLKPGSNPCIYIRKYIKEKGLDTSHFLSVSDYNRSWSIEDLRKAADNALNMAEVFRRLNLLNRGINKKVIVREAEKYGIELPLNEKANTNSFVYNVESFQQKKKEGFVKQKYTLDDYLSNRIFIHSDRLKKLLLRAGLLKEVCSICSQGPIWNNLPLTMQLDHIDGNPQNNNFINLQLLCPNCHTQTKTWGYKRRDQK